MPYILSSRYFLIGLLFLFLGSLAIYLCLPDSVKLQGASDGIRDVEMEVADSKIYLNVHLSRPQSCRDVVKNLGIDQFSIHGRIYIPECSQVNSELIKIIYSVALIV